MEPVLSFSALANQRRLYCLWLLFLLQFVFTVFPGGSVAVERQIWETIVVPEEIESALQLGVVDLQRYVGQVTGQVPNVCSSSDWQADPRPAVFVFQTDKPPISEIELVATDQLTSQGYLLQQTSVRNQPVVLVTARTAQGLVNGIYGLLYELGFGFYLGSEAIPDSLPGGLPQQAVLRNPALAIRGVLPWHNFFNSPTTWDPVDYRSIIDQLVRMRANFIGFHVYDDEPFAAWERKSRMVQGRRLASTRVASWGTYPMPTRDFSSGSSALFAEDYFGAETTLEDNDDQAIRREQEVMNSALAYARARGLHTCLGFEVQGDPTDADVQEQFRRRFRSLIKTYPALDYIWLWQREIQGARGTPVPLEKTAAGEWITSEPLGLYGLARMDRFSRVVNARANPRYIYRGQHAAVARAVEGARLEIFARIALRILEQYKDAPRLVLSGWGGEDRMISAEYYEGLDTLLPKHVVFASLEFMVPRARIDSIYGELPPDRERWPIAWLEYDGDQWHPQPYVHTFEKMMKNVRKSDSQGILGIHWRTREVEENLAYLLQWCWEEGLTAGKFFSDYAERHFPPGIASRMAEILLRLDRLGYRWVGGRGQAEYKAFEWGPGRDPRKVSALEGILNECRALLPEAGRGTKQLVWLIQRIDYVLKFQEMATAAASAKKKIQDARAATETSETEKLAEDAIAVLAPEKLHDAVQAYCLRVSTRGEHGVLATINTKAVHDWRETLRAAHKLLGTSYTTPTTTWKSHPRILLPRFYSSWPEGSPIEMYPVVLGDQPAWTHYRRLGEQHWATESLPLFQRSVYYAHIPAAVAESPGVEIAFSFNEDPSEPPDFGPFAVSIFPQVQPPAPRLVNAKRGGPVELKIQQKERGTTSTILSWNEVSSAEYYRVFRNAAQWADTPLTFIPLPASGTGKWRVEALHESEVLSAAEISLPNRKASGVQKR